MKFVYNEEKNKEMRHILMMQPTVEEAEALLAKDDTDGYAWYVFRHHLSGSSSEGNTGCENLVL